MRKYVGAAVALIVVIAAYWGWALAGAAELASAARRGDATAVMERVDISALSRSLSGQISRAYLEQNPQLRKLLALKPGLADGVGMNAAAAEMLLRAFLTPENIAALLNQGRPNADAGTLWRMPGLGEALRADPMQILAHSYFDGPSSFVVALDSADGPYRAHMNLSGATWRLSGLDIPDQVTARVARQIAERVGGLMERPGG